MGIRDRYLQEEVSEGKVEVSKIPGEENPADLMTAIVGLGYIKERLERMHINIRDLSSSIMHIAAVFSLRIQFPQAIANCSGEYRDADPAMQSQGSSSAAGMQGAASGVRDAGSGAATKAAPGISTRPHDHA